MPADVNLYIFTTASWFDPMQVFANNGTSQLFTLRAADAPGRQPRGYPVWHDRMTAPGNLPNEIVMISYIPKKIGEGRCLLCFKNLEPLSVFM